MKVIGIDPGKDGAFAIVEDTRLLITETFPKVGSTKELCFRSLHKRLEALTLGVDLVLIERVQAIRGASAGSTFSFGRSYQMAIDACSLIRSPTEFVKPMVWQKQVFKGETPQYKITKSGKRNKKDTKKMAQVVASRLFPNEKFLRSERCTMPHDGMIDAALIAYWGANFRHLC